MSRILKIVSDDKLTLEIDARVLSNMELANLQNGKAISIGGVNFHLVSPDD